MLKISDWYSYLSEYSFPTAFLTLSKQEIEVMLNKDFKSSCSKELDVKMRRALRSFPGGIFVSTDICAPVDSKRFVYGRGVWTTAAARNLLIGSEKVVSALKNGDTSTLVFRPSRRMSKPREFRLFVYNGELVAMSQYHLERHFARLDGIKDKLWKSAQEFFDKIKEKLHTSNLVIDVYFTSSKHFIIIDLNEWGPKTDPKLLRSWDIDWEKDLGIKLIAKPIKMKGEISVSF